MRALRAQQAGLRPRPGGTTDCEACQPGGSDGDPAAIVAGIIAVIDPGVLAGTVAAAVHAAAPGAGQRRRLAWALQDHPELLTGGARAPVPSVLRLIDALADAGAQRIVRPACRIAGGSLPWSSRATGCGSAATA